MADEILCSIEQRIATITLNRPARRNAFDAAMVAQASTFLDEVERDRGVRALVVRGEGPAFCGGLDLRRYGHGSDEARDPEVEVIGLLRRIERLRPVTIAVVHGAAFAGGCLLALHCDLRLASPAALFAMPLARIGIAVPFPMVQKLVDELGPATARWMLLTGEPVRAEEALGLGLIHRLVGAAELDARAQALAAEVADNAPLAVATMKAMIGRALSLRDQIAHEDLAARALEARTSHDAVEGVAAMLEKRKPRFRGA